MTNTRHKDANWNLRPALDNTLTWPQIHTALLMDIRDELKRLNSLLYCHNFTDIPNQLRLIRLNTKKPKRKKAGSGK